MGVYVDLHVLQDYFLYSWGKRDHTKIGEWQMSSVDSFKCSSSSYNHSVQNVMSCVTFEFVSLG